MQLATAFNVIHAPAGGEGEQGYGLACMGENACALSTYLELKVLDAHCWRTSSIIPEYLSAHILSQPSLSRYFTWLCLACWSHERAFPQVATFLDLAIGREWLEELSWLAPAQPLNSSKASARSQIPLLMKPDFGWLFVWLILKRWLLSGPFLSLFKVDTPIFTRRLFLDPTSFLKFFPH